MRVYDYKDVSKRAPKKARRFLKKLLPKKGSILTWLFRVFALGVGVVALVFIYFSFTLPDPNTLLQRTVAESTKILDRNGELLYEIHGEAKRTLVPLEDINPYVKGATVAIEDKDFYKHKGISFRGIFRSVIKDITSGSKAQGGSTITQQFVKNALLTSDKRISRKLKEIILSIEIEARYSKDEILQLYLNEIPYGRNAYGIEAAAQTYFKKHARDLTLAESAYLAALPQAPTYYNPLGPNREVLDSRHNTILRAMKDQGYISEEELNSALEEKVEFTQVTNSLKAPHFVLYIQSLLAEKYGESTLQEGGIVVTTTLDLRLQELAEQAIKDQAESNAERSNAQNSGLVALDPKTGQILAMVGSKDYFGESFPEGCTSGKDCLFDPAVNVALTQRQPGSSIKPFIYLEAFKEEHGMSPATMLFDVVTNFGTFNGKAYMPKNYSGKTHGPTNIRSALAGSLNIPAVKVLALVGVENATQTARDLGITSPLKDCGLSLVLGGCEVRLLDHTNAYATLAAGGVYHKATGILKIQDRKGEVLEEYKEDGKRVVDEQAVYEITSILTDNNARSYIFGTNNNIYYPERPVACKTGTTNDWRDGWTMCYTPSIAVGVWSGNNVGTMKAGADGTRVSAPVVKNFIRGALKDTPPEDFSVPSKIQKVIVDSVSGKLPTEYTTSTKEEVFADYAVPKDFDNVHVAIKIDTTTGQPANSFTLPQNIALQYYTVYQSEQPNNPNWEEPVQAWVRDNGILLPPYNVDLETPPPPGEAPIINITSPDSNSLILTQPFNVITSVLSSSSISRVDLLVDGQVIESKTSTPFDFKVNRNLSEGAHTIAIHAVDSEGRSSDKAISISVSTNQLLLTNPKSSESYGQVVNLEAISGSNLGQVTFYIDGQAAGTTTGILQNGRYEYSMLWISPGDGTYKVQARAPGKQSKEVEFTSTKDGQ